MNSASLRVVPVLSATNAAQWQAVALMLGLSQLAVADVAPADDAAHLRVSAGSSATSQVSIVGTEVSVGEVVSALQSFAQSLVNAQTDFDPDVKRAVYSNLWDLYD